MLRQLHFDIENNKVWPACLSYRMLGNKALVKISPAIASVNSLRETQPPAAGLNTSGAIMDTLGTEVDFRISVFIFARNIHHTRDG